MQGHFRHTPTICNVRSFIDPNMTTVYYSTIPHPIYLISLLWELGLGLGLDLELHYFSFFHRA